MNRTPMAAQEEERTGMLGQLIFEERGGGRAERAQLYGLTVLRAGADPEGWLGRRRLQKAGRALRRGGALRTLAPAGFQQWALLENCGLISVNPLAFLRAQGAPLALGALERQGLAPDRSAVTLRGERVDRELTRAAVALCPQVRHLVIDAPRGGSELAAWLRREFGIPVLPAGEPAPVSLGFGPREKAEPDGGEAGVRLSLYGARPDLAGLTVTAPSLAREDQAQLPLLAALWEEGRLPPEGIKIT